jgi:hypothetical protein
VFEGRERYRPSLKKVRTFRKDANKCPRLAFEETVPGEAFKVSRMNDGAPTSIEEPLRNSSVVSYATNITFSRAPFTSEPRAPTHELKRYNSKFCHSDNTISNCLDSISRLPSRYLLVHDQDGSEPHFPTQHMLVRLLCIFQWKRLNQALYIMKLRERDSLLAVECMTRRVSGDRSRFQDQVIGIASMLPHGDSTNK